MKEIYTKPVSQVEEFSAMDVLTASGIVDPINPSWGIEQGEVED